MAKIYLVRHCESEGNATRRTQAQTDALVTVKGYEQNEVLRRRFHGVHLDAIYASDAFRSIATADPIAKERGLPIRVRISLREVTTGVWEDMAWGNIAQEYPEESGLVGRPLGQHHPRRQLLPPGRGKRHALSAAHCQRGGSRRRSHGRLSLLHH